MAPLDRCKFKQFRVTLRRHRRTPLLRRKALSQKHFRRFRAPMHLDSCRVEEGRGFRLRQSRFPSPLIERSMRISRTALSDWLHLAPVGGAPR